MKFPLKSSEWFQIQYYVYASLNKYFSLIIPISALYISLSLSLILCLNHSRYFTAQVLDIFMLLVTMVVAQLVQWSFPTPDISGSNPVIGNLFTINCIK